MFAKLILAAAGQRNWPFELDHTARWGGRGDPPVTSRRIDTALPQQSLCCLGCQIARGLPFRHYTPLVNTRPFDNPFMGGIDDSL